MKPHFSPMFPEYERMLKAGGEELVQLVSLGLSGSDYERGELETLQAGSDAKGDFLGRLTLLLLTKGIITKDEIKRLLE